MESVFPYVYLVQVKNNNNLGVKRSPNPNVQSRSPSHILSPNQSRAANPANRKQGIKKKTLTEDQQAKIYINLSGWVLTRACLSPSLTYNTASRSVFNMIHTMLRMTYACRRLVNMHCFVSHSTYSG